MNSTATIITADYLHYALALNESLLKFQDIPFYALIVDKELDEQIIKASFPNVHFLYLQDINKTEIAKKIINKYSGIYEDALRWSLKSVLASYLLENYDKVLILDCDLYFYNDYNFLFDELDINDVLLTPHWRNSDPYSTHNSFDLLFYSGLFNAGFVAVNTKGKEVMDWWSMCCEYKCEINSKEGHYVDQTYLNLMPIYFENVKILRHRGCNISEWNRIECKRTQMSNGEIVINEKYPIIFIHFIKYLIQDIESGVEPLLSEHLSIWKKALENYKVFSEPYENSKILDNPIKTIETTETMSSPQVSLLRKIKQDIRIRTRLKRFLKG